MTVLKIFLFIFVYFTVISAKISDKRLCADPACSEVISLAKTVLRFPSDDKRILSFQPNEQVKIFSKSAGSNVDLWGAEIRGKRGYVPVKFIRETKIHIRDAELKYLVDTEEDAIKNEESVIIEAPTTEKTEVKTEEVTPDISPNTVTPPYEIIDGTTLYLNPIDDTQYTTPPSIDNLNSETVPNSVSTETITQAPPIIISNDLKSPENDLTEQTSTEKIENETEEKIDENESTEKEVKEELKTDENKQISGNSDDSPEQLAKQNIETSTETAEKETNESDLNEQNKEISEKDKILDSISKYLFENINEEFETEEEEEDDTEIDIEEEEEEEENNVEDGAEDEEEVEGNKIETTVNNENNKETGEIKNSDKKDINKNVENENLQNSGESDVQVGLEDTINQLKSDSTENVIDEVVNNNIINQINNESEPNLDANILEQKSVDSIKNNNENIGVPSENSLNLLLNQNKIEEIDKSIENQVPVLFTTSENKQTIIESDIKTPEFVPTTESSNVIEDPLPSNILTETFTETPNSEPLPDDSKTPEFIDIQHDISSQKTETFPNLNANDINFESSEKESKIFNAGFISINEYDSIKNENNIQSNPNTEEVINEDQLLQNPVSTTEESGFFSNLYTNIFGASDDLPENIDIDNNIETAQSENVNKVEEINNEPSNINSYSPFWSSHEKETPVDKYLPSQQTKNIKTTPDMQTCDSKENPSCALHQNFIKSENGDITWSYEIPDNAYNIFLYLSLTSVTVLLFSLGYYYLEKHRKDGQLIANINELEKKLLITTKECQIIEEELKTTKNQLFSVEDNTSCSTEILTLKEELQIVQKVKLELEEHVASLESSLENSLEEITSMLNEITELMKTIQLHEDTINKTQTTLAEKNTENELLQTELSVTNEKIIQLQTKLDKIIDDNLIEEEEKQKSKKEFEDQIQKLKTELNSNNQQLTLNCETLKEEKNKLKMSLENTQRLLELKSNEYDLLKQGMEEIQGAQSNKDSIMALLDVSHVKAEVQQLREEKHKLSDKLQNENEKKQILENEVQVMMQEVKILKDKFEEAEREKVEAETRLEVLSSYFKERESQLQKEINENESKWVQKEGEASSTIERIKWIQEELQNYKSQNELLKKEILDQEVSLKSQISMLEKKSHENWLLLRQAERRLEESKQEASQLRNRLTIVEKNLSNNSQMTDDKMQNRILSPLESNGDLAVSPLHMGNVENPGSPPLLYHHPDHLTTSPPLPGMPPPFMPPPHGMPFMPPPLSGVPPFMPPPPALFPGDHRPPPLGRMSSPPLHGRYSPDSRPYSPFDRDDSPPLSPDYTDNCRSPPSPRLPPLTNFNRYNKGRPLWERDEDREFRQHNRNKPRAHKGLSSGSGNSNESLENSGRNSGRV